MFRKVAQTPQRKAFNLTNDQIVDDIERIKVNEEQKEKLFSCLDEKLPSERRYKEVEVFLKGTRDLEQILQVLKAKAGEIKELEEQLRISVETVRRKTEEVLEEDDGGGEDRNEI